MSNTNTPKGTIVQSDIEYRYFEALPREWRDWINDLEFSVKIEGIWYQYSKGIPLHIVKAYHKDFFREYKHRQGWKDGFNGC